MYFDRVVQIPGPGRLVTEFCAMVCDVGKLCSPVLWYKQRIPDPFYRYESNVFRYKSKFFSLHFLSLTTADWLCTFISCKYDPFGESYNSVTSGELPRIS